MQTSPTAAAVPAGWQGVPLATISYLPDDFGSPVSAPAFASPAVLAPADAPVFTRVGPELDAAVTAARAAAQRTIWAGDSRTYVLGHAHAVLQAEDGAYWIAALSRTPEQPEHAVRREPQFHVLDGDTYAHHYMGTNVESHTPDLVAVVGTETTMLPPAPTS